MVNKKLFILAIASALILPGAIYADLMVTGYINGGSHPAPDTISLSFGPNYANAASAGLFNFVPVKQNPSGNLGTITLYGSEFQTVELLNVLSVSLASNLVNGTLYFSILNSNFTLGVIVFGSSLLNITDLSNPGAFADMRSINLSGGTANISIENSMVLYFGFYLPPGSYGGDHLDLTANYVRL